MLSAHEFFINFVRSSYIGRQKWAAFRRDDIRPSVRAYVTLGEEPRAYDLVVILSILYYIHERRRFRHRHSQPSMVAVSSDDPNPI